MISVEEYYLGANMPHDHYVDLLMPNFAKIIDVFKEPSGGVIISFINDRSVRGNITRKFFIADSNQSFEIESSNSIKYIGTFDNSGNVSGGKSYLGKSYLFEVIPTPIPRVIPASDMAPNDSIATVDLSTTQSEDF